MLTLFVLSCCVAGPVKAKPQRKIRESPHSPCCLYHSSQYPVMANALCQITAKLTTQLVTALIMSMYVKCVRQVWREMVKNKYPPSK